MNVGQFERRTENGQFYVGQRLWFFGAKYQGNWGNPGLHVPLSEGEIMHIDRNGNATIAYVSTKTGRPFQSKYLPRGTNYSVRGVFNRDNEIQIFETEEEAIEAYRPYLEEKTNEINQIIEEKTAKYIKWLNELQEPLN